VADSPEPELGLTTPLPGTTPAPVLGLVFVPAPESVGDADGLPEPESDGDGDGDGDCDGLDDGDGGGDVAGWDGGAELCGVLGAAECDGAGEAPAAGDTLVAGQVTAVKYGRSDGRGPAGTCTCTAEATAEALAADPLPCAVPFTVGLADGAQVDVAF
jgi:hypothetical protein